MSGVGKPIGQGQQRRQAEDILGQLSSREGILERSEERLPARLSEFDRRQSRIAAWIIYLYVGVIIAIVAAYAASAIWPQLAPLSAAADRIRELANTLVLPIVTLVLGYYFGKRAE